MTANVKSWRQRTRTALVRIIWHRNPPESKRDACSVSEVPEGAGTELAVTEAAAEEMDAETAPAKRRHEDVVAVPQAQRLKQIEASVGVGAKNNAQCCPRACIASIKGRQK
ncbi:hypothetical protein MTO96_018047 [Rhipicephalus appendiculatus]